MAIPGEVDAPGESCRGKGVDDNAVNCQFIASTQSPDRQVLVAQVVDKRWDDLRDLYCAVLEAPAVCDGVEGERKGSSQAVELQGAIRPLHFRDATVPGLRHLSAHSIQPDVGHLLPHHTLRLEEEIGHHHVSVVVGMDAVVADNGEGRVGLLLLHVQSHHRGIQIEELPAVSRGSLLLDGNDALHVVVLAGKDVVVEGRCLVVRRSANHNGPHPFQALQLLLAKGKVLLGFLQFSAGKVGRIGTTVLVVSRVVHTECKGEDCRLLRQHIVVKASQYLLRRIATHTTVSHPKPHLGEVGHVVEPDVGVVVSAISNAIPHECHAVALLEGGNALRLQKEQGAGGREQEEKEDEESPHVTTTTPHPIPCCYRSANLVLL